MTRSTQWLWMTLGIYAAVGLAPAGCGGAAPSTSDEPTEPHDDEPDDEPQDHDPPEPEGFTVEMLSSTARAPVVAVTADERHHAFVDDEGTARLAFAGGNPVPLPAEGASTSVALTADDDEALHVSWDAGGAIHYVRIETDGAMNAPFLVDEVGRDPSVAVSPSGRVVVAFTQDVEEGAARVMVAEGKVAGTFGGFGAPQQVNSGCCVDDLGGPAYAVSGPSLALGPDGAIHVLYEWMSSFNTTIDYVTEVDGAFSEPLPIAEAAFSPCPALAVDADGAHVTYVLEQNRDVWYVNVIDGEAGEARSVYHSDDAFVLMALMKRDASGDLQLAVHQRNETGDELIYIRGDAAPESVSTTELGTQIALSPRSGGLVLADEEVLIPFTTTTNDELAEAMLAVGR